MQFLMERASVTYLKSFLHKLRSYGDGDMALSLIRQTGENETYLRQVQ